jgi:hypothetical protein
MGLRNCLQFHTRMTCRRWWTRTSHMHSHQSPLRASLELNNRRCTAQRGASAPCTAFQYTAFQCQCTLYGNVHCVARQSPLPCIRSAVCIAPVSYNNRVACAFARTMLNSALRCAAVHCELRASCMCDQLLASALTARLHALCDCSLYRVKHILTHTHTTARTHHALAAADNRACLLCTLTRTVVHALHTHPHCCACMAAGSLPKLPRGGPRHSRPSATRQEQRHMMKS